VNDYTDLLEAARKSRLALVKDLVAALEAEIAETKRQRNLLICAASDLAWARGFIETSTGQDVSQLQATEAKMLEVFGPREEGEQG
jgi:hypothetical protein